MTTPDQARAIAAGLTDAERCALKGVRQMYAGESLVDSGSQRRTLLVLVTAGLIERSTVFVETYRLTPLGLAVRAILQEQSNG